MAISTLAYKLVADTSQFTSGMVATRKELNLAKQLMTSSKSETQQLGDALNSLEALFRKGAFGKGAEAAQHYENAVRRVRGEFFKATQEVQQHTGAIDGWLGKIAGGVAIGNMISSALHSVVNVARQVTGALIDVTRTQMDEADKIAKMVDRTGFDPRILAAWARGANYAGISTDAFAKSLQIMQRNIGQARLGTGEARKALEALGLNLTDIARIKPEEQFLAIAEAMRRTSDETERMGLVTMLFGRGGAEMLNFLSQSSEEFQSLIDQAEKFGIALDREALYQIEKANDAITEMEAAWAGIGRQLAVEIAPAVKAVVATLQVALDQYRAFKSMLPSPEAAPKDEFEALVPTKGDIVAEGAKALLRPFAGPGVDAGAFVGEQLGEAVAETRAATAAEYKTRDMQKKRDDAQAEARQLEEEIKAAQSMAQDLAMRMLFSPPTVGKQLDIVERQERLEEYKEAERIRKEAAAEWDKTMAEGERVTRRFLSPSELLEAKLLDINRLFKAGAIDAATWNRTVDAEVADMLKQERPATASGNVALLKGSSQAFSAEQERLRVEDERWRAEERREKIKLEVLNKIATHTDPKLREPVKEVGI